MKKKHLTAFGSKFNQILNSKDRFLTMPSSLQVEFRSTKSIQKHIQLNCVKEMSYQFKRSIIWVVFFNLLLAFNLSAQNSSDEWPVDEDWGDEWTEESLWSQSGFVEAAQGERFQSDQLINDSSTLSEIRWNQQFQYSDEQLDFNWTHDIWLDDVIGGLQFDLRELNFKFSLGEKTDVILGRQISTWGKGDLVFINDMFPKDWQSFFAGRDVNYLKAPADALRVTSYLSAFNIDLVITPSATPDRFVSGERFSFFSPLAMSQLGGSEIINPKNPNTTEYAMRLFKNFDGYQFALYGYHGVDKSPTGIDSLGQAYFPNKNVFGASFQTTIGKGVFQTEVGHHNSLDDKKGVNPLVPNSQWRFLIGYERELAKKLNWGVQYYLEHNENHTQLINSSLSPQYEPEQNRHLITNRLTYQLWQDKLTWSLFVFYSPTDKDSFWRPSVTYRHNDQWQFSSGAQLFKGKYDHTFFGQFADASHLYVKFRFSY